MNPWTVLGIPPTDDRDTIRRAYADAVKRHRPDRDPAGYQSVRAAYDEVLSWLDDSEPLPAPPSPTATPAAGLAAGDPDPVLTGELAVDQDAEASYTACDELTVRRDSEAFLDTLARLLEPDGLRERMAWGALLTSPILLDLVVRPQLSRQAFRQLAEHCRIHPKAPRYSRFQWAAQRLNDVFHWDQDELALVKAFPTEDIDAVMRAIAGPRAVATARPARRQWLVARAVLASIVITLALWMVPWPDSPLEAARVQLQAGEFEAAERSLRSLRQLYPADPEIARLLGLSLLEQNDPGGAIEALDQALFLRADDGLSYYFRGQAHQAARSWRAAKADLVKAAQLLPRFHDVQNHAAWFLATSPDPAARDGALAVQLAEAAVALARRAYYVDTLAAAHAEAGDFAAAVLHQQEAASLLAAQTPEAVRAGFLERLELYRSGRPFRTE